MKCEDVRNLFSEYYDDETDKSGEIALHLDGCPDCTREFEEYRGLFIRLANIKEPEVPRGFRRELVSYTEGFYSGRKRHVSLIVHRFTSVLSSMAAAAAAVLVVWFIFAHDTGTAVDERPEMIAELAVPQAAAEVYEYDEPPFVRGFVFEEADYDFAIGIFDDEWYYADDYDVWAWEEIITEAEDFGFFDPVFFDVGYDGSRSILPHFTTAAIFLVIGLFLGFVAYELLIYIDRKLDDAS